MQPDERGILGVQGRQVFDLADYRLEVAPVIGVMHGGAPMLAVQQQLHAAQAPLNLADLRNGARRVENGGRDRLDVLLLRDRKDEARFALQRRLDRAQGRRPSGADGHRHAGKQHNLPKRKHRERQFLRHMVSTRMKVENRMVSRREASPVPPLQRRAEHARSVSLRPIRQVLPNSHHAGRQRGRAV